MFKRKEYKDINEIIGFQIDEKYSDTHNYLIYCNSILVDWLKWVDKKYICRLKIDLKNEEMKRSFSEIKKDNLMDWLKENGYSQDMYEMNRRHILCSLVADFCHYMVESFMCAAKMKPAVAYALLRKPLRDTLAYIEWLGAEPEELIDKLLYGRPEDYDLSRSKELKRQHIEAVSEKYNIDRENGMFVFRYEKNEDISLEKIWNKANHIVTTQNYTKSSDGELNFIFMNQEMYDQYTGYYYTVVPHIMSYATALIVKMFEEIAKVNQFTEVINNVLMLLRQSYAMGINFFEEAKQTLEIENLPLICPYCGKKINMDNKTVDEIFFNKFKCKKCHKGIDTFSYVFDYEDLNSYLNGENNL